MHKYKINAILQNLRVDDYRHAVRELPTLLDITPSTFRNYCKIKLDEKKDVPHEVVRTLETYFNIPIGSLWNGVPKICQRRREL